MIGGEFDLSAGVMVYSAGLLNAMFSYQLGINLWVGAVIALLFALSIGFFNGYMVMRTGIPSFLITLGPSSCSKVSTWVSRSWSPARCRPRTSTRWTATLAERDLRPPVQHRRRQARHHRAVVVPLRGHRALDAHPQPGRQLDLRRRWQRAQRPRRRCAGAPGQDRPVHGRLVPRLVHGHAHAVQLQHPPGRATASATSSSTSSPRSSVARCSPVATATRSVSPSVRSSSA